jgi:hypothetical protein
MPRSRRAPGERFDLTSHVSLVGVARSGGDLGGPAPTLDDHLPRETGAGLDAIPRGANPVCEAGRDRIHAHAARTGLVRESFACQ